MTSGRRTGQLHLNRITASGTIYFVTGCTHHRQQSLVSATIANGLLAAIKTSDGLKDTKTFAFTVMPDHWHWVFECGERLSFGRLIARFKSQTRGLLQQRGMAWQRDFYEHRLLPSEDPADYALYVFLNPYRARLISSDTTWPWWWSGEPSGLRFTRLLNAGGTPPAEWIDQEVPASVRHGE